MKRFFATLLAALMLVTMIPVSVSAAEAEYTITPGCMSTVTETRTRLTGELTVKNSGDELIVKLFSGETQIATTTLVNADYIGKDDVTLSWNFVISGEASSSWVTEWTAGHPKADAEPTKVVLCIDGNDVAENTVNLFKNNDCVPGEDYDWAELIPAPAYTITPGCMSTVTETRTRLTGELTVKNSGDELIVKLFSGETQIATTTLVNADYIGKDDVTLSWNFVISGEASSSWVTEWTAGHPKADAAPTKVVLCIDGVDVAENTVNLYKNNDCVPGEDYDWAELIPEPELDLGLDKEVMELLVGETGRLSVTVSPEGYEAPAYTLESSNPAVATVDADGTVTAVAAGEASIALMIDGEEYGSCLVTVTEPETPVSESFLPFIVTGVTQVKVVDAETEEAVQGAVFELYRISPTGSRKLHGTYTSNATGRITARTLSPRYTYELVMTAAPEGYDLLEAPVVFRVQYNRPLQQVVPVAKTVAEEAPVESAAA